MDANTLLVVKMQRRTFIMDPSYYPDRNKPLFNERDGEGDHNSTRGI
jgi:hypothetical protein